MHEELLLSLARDSCAEGDRIVDMHALLKKINIYININTRIIHIYTYRQYSNIHACTHNMVYEELLIK